MKRITSRQNPLIALYRDVARGNNRSLILLDGSHLVGDALDAGVPLRHAAVGGDPSAATAHGRLVARLILLGVEMVEASTSVMAALSPVRSSSTIVALADRPPDRSQTVFVGPAPLVIAAVGVQDPGNLGAIVRAAEAGRANGVFAAGQSADPFGWKALRGSMGSALRLPVSSERSLDQLFLDARHHGCRIVAAVPRGGRDPIDTRLDGPTLLLLGGEGHGLAPEARAAAEEFVTIPMAPPVESLNTATCAAILIYEARRQRLASVTHGLALPARS
jgi:TrmH family RNA methyltransferase